MKRPAFKTYPDGRQVCHKTVAGRMEYRRRIELMWTRQQAVCALCGQYLRFEQATFDHEFGRGMGGGKRDDRIFLDGVPQNAAVHGFCNVAKGSRVVGYVVAPFAEVR